MCNQLNQRGVYTLGSLSPTSGEPLGKDKHGNPVRQRLERWELQAAMAHCFGSDACYVGYDVFRNGVPVVEPPPRLTHNVLQPLRDAGYEVTCDKISSDFDLKDIVAPKIVAELRAKFDPSCPKVSWAWLNSAQEREVIERTDALVAELARRGLPHAAFYRTPCGFRLLHLLSTPVPAGAKFERMLENLRGLHAALGMPSDKGCVDWTRFMRLPKVTRPLPASLLRGAA